jgi:hypothetical protein
MAVITMDTSERFCYELMHISHSVVQYAFVVAPGRSYRALRLRDPWDTLLALQRPIISRNGVFSCPYRTCPLLAVSFPLPSEPESAKSRLWSLQRRAQRLYATI